MHVSIDTEWAVDKRLTNIASHGTYLWRIADTEKKIKKKKSLFE